MSLIVREDAPEDKEDELKCYRVSFL